MSLLEEAQKGRLPGLEALRDYLATELEVCDSARDKASLSLRFVDVLEQIEELSGGSSASSAPASPLDELRRKRAERSKTG